jgi:hypothetical protein
MSFGNHIALSFESFFVDVYTLSSYHKIIKIATPLREIDSTYVIH